MKINDELEKDQQIILTIQREIAIVTAVLLLTGQITIIGVFVTPGGFRASLGGPLTGASRIESKTGSQTVNLIIDIIDIVLALLLIGDELRVTGSFIAPGSFTINVGGPIFGVPMPEPNLPTMKNEYRFFQRIVDRHFHVDPNLVEKLTK
ncbi:hypothetical protein P9E76_06885 [Schinkia azotoformans]|uniref:Uncharacterized protein n=1 Tax=Schinkia azotoformans LMG 9581 TaxID=1131731 RepID=K6D8F7_SCHAZ|nr:hypothetical protein [Schinkia azotoformans]EKN64564.1 hypothetical protein BAZO_13174 [Schinkia azotoformans LMG 9581]MEC1637875.1 hypothetical protein [Schinkia azotoformans]MEC1721735.1 hypothetical protein [Schinkia azotoformans]MEC1944771.1 hypothetical protein [Schinkia azotoformans]MED4354123.1 hypothetical protein [Schinkia azotoformans]